MCHSKVLQITDEEKKLSEHERPLPRNVVINFSFFREQKKFFVHMREIKGSLFATFVLGEVLHYFMCTCKKYLLTFQLQAG